MKFLLCCLKRNHAKYDVSSTKLSYTNSNAIIPTVTSAPLPVSPDIPVVPTYENIIRSPVDGKIGINNEQPASTASMESDGYATITSTRALKLSFDDTELYATVDKTRKAKNALKIKIDATSATDAALSQGSLPASATGSSPQTRFSSSSHPSDSTKTSKHLSLPLQVYTNITVSNNHDNTSSHHHPHYENVETRKSLQNRVRYSKMEGEQTEQKQQLRKNHYLYVNSDRQTTNTDDLYAELGDGSTLDHNPQSHFYSQPLNGSEVDDDLSERYATIINVNNTEEQSTTNDIFQELDSVIF